MVSFFATQTLDRAFSSQLNFCTQQYSIMNLSLKTVSLNYTRKQIKQQSFFCDGPRSSSKSQNSTLNVLWPQRPQKRLCQYPIILKIASNHSFLQRINGLRSWSKSFFQTHQNVGHIHTYQILYGMRTLFLHGFDGKQVHILYV